MDPNVTNTMVPIRLKKGQINKTSSKRKSNDPTSSWLWLWLCLCLLLLLLLIVMALEH